MIELKSTINQTSGTLEKRTWMYVQPPASYEIQCDKCGGTNIAWSEYAQHIWCYDCKIDTPGTMGIFDGPIPVQTCAVLGIDLNRFDIERSCLENLKDQIMFICPQCKTKSDWINESEVSEKNRICPCGHAFWEKHSRFELAKKANL